MPDGLYVDVFESGAVFYHYSKLMGKTFLTDF